MSILFLTNLYGFLSLIVSFMKYTFTASILHFKCTVDVDAVEEFIEALEVSRRCTVHTFIVFYSSKEIYYFLVVSGEFEVVLPEAAEEDMAEARKDVSSE